MSPEDWEKVSEYSGHSDLHPVKETSESILSVFAIVCIFMNLACIATIMSKRSKVYGSTKVFFVSMHAWDILFVLGYLMEEGVQASGITSDETVLETAANVGKLVNQIARAFSNLLIAAISFDRVMSVKRPLYFKTNMTNSRRYKVFVVSFAFTLAVATRWTQFSPHYEGQSEMFIALKLYSPTVTDMILTAVIIVNSGIVIFHLYCSSSNSIGDASKMKANRSTTNLLICACVAFMIEQVMYTTDEILEFREDDFSGHFGLCTVASDVMSAISKEQIPTAVTIARDWSSFWSHGAGFIMYCIFNAEIRRAFFKVWPGNKSSVTPSSHAAWQ